VSQPDDPMAPLASSHPLYGISVAAELTGVHPQMLRSYEAHGLIGPHRTDGGTRRYSGADVTRVHRITGLLSTGLNLEGVQQVLALEDETRRLRAEIARLQSEQSEQSDQ
jgi:MerR family transcriptional regulator/heat shock protein HspR